ncbi:MAG: hypothetical protein OXJ52_01705 [Oligoflexia bacterium]|nr:hypothetical protein [Oligoflexia bacterium]
MILLFLISLSFSVQSLELDTKSFYFCAYKTATQVKNRTVRIHYFPEEKKCAVFYTVKGTDKIIASGRWLAFCKTKADQLVENLQKELWKCKFSNQEVKVFYPLDQEKSLPNDTSSES